MKQPDLMGTHPPPGNSSTPLYEYSADLAGDYLGGLAMMRKGTTCRTSYSSSEAAPNPVTAAPNKWAVHAWTTPEFDSDFHLGGRATVSIWTQTLGGVSGPRLPLRDADRAARERRHPLRHHDRVDDLRRLHLADHSAPPELHLQRAHRRHRHGQRLVLVLHLRGESTHDIALLYDHPSYQSLLEVETTTPIGG